MPLTHQVQDVASQAVEAEPQALYILSSPLPYRSCSRGLKKVSYGSGRGHIKQDAVWGNGSNNSINNGNTCSSTNNSDNKKQYANCIGFRSGV